MGKAAMPTQDGQAPGKVSMSGGWTWAIPPKAGNPELAWKFIKPVSDAEHAAKWDIDNARSPCGPTSSGDPTYTDGQPDQRVLHRRWCRSPTTGRRTPQYPQVSNEIQVAMESVMTGRPTSRRRAKTYRRRRSRPSAGTR